MTCSRSMILSQTYVRPSPQLFAEMDDIWERRLDDFEKTGKRNPKRFNDTHKKFQLALNVYLNTTYYKEEKNWYMLLNHYYDVLLYDRQHELLLERTFSNDKSKRDNRSSNDKSDRSGKSRQLDGYTVSYHPCTYCGKNHCPSVCQLINHPEANK